MRGYARGLCLLFYGPSGTGKTMTANAVSLHLGMKVLLVTVPLVLENQLTKVSLMESAWGYLRRSPDLNSPSSSAGADAISVP